MQDKLLTTGWPPSIDFCPFTISMDSSERAYTDSDPKHLQESFKEICRFYFNTIHERLKKQGSRGAHVLSQSIMRQLGTVVFGSNNIDRVGLDIEETIKICRRVFRGEHIDPAQIPPRQVICPGHSLPLSIAHEAT